MSYSVIKNENGAYSVYETPSSVTIDINKTKEKDARDICRKLNLGSGFGGWTPLFFSKGY